MFPNISIVVIISKPLGWPFELSEYFVFLAKSRYFYYYRLLIGGEWNIPMLSPWTLLSGYMRQLIRPPSAPIGIWPSGTNFRQIGIKLRRFLYKISLKMPPENGKHFAPALMFWSGSISQNISHHHPVQASYYSFPSHIWDYLYNDSTNDHYGTLSQ